MSFRGEKPKLLLSVIEGRGQGTGTVGGQAATIITTYYRDLCNAPCDVEIQPGVHEFFAYGGGHVVVSRKLDLRAGNTVVDLEPGSSALRFVGIYGTYLGLGGMVAGGTLLGLSVIDGAEIPTEVGAGLLGASSSFIRGLDAARA